jgi:hypothetical protein
VAASVTGLKSVRLFLRCYLKQRVYNPLQKTLEDLRSTRLDERNKKQSGSNVKKTFLNFQKGANFLFPLVAVIFIVKEGHLYLTINGILSSLKWYITCGMVTRGYFFINVLKIKWKYLKFTL